jgi:hypothetical protein
LSAEARRKLEREIEKLLLFLRTNFAELGKFGPIAGLDRSALRRHQAWPIAEEALRSIWLVHRMLEERLASLSAVYRNPLATLSQESRTFYDDVYLPSIEAAIDLFLPAISIDIDGEDSEDRRPVESAAQAERIEPYSGLELTQFRPVFVDPSAAVPSWVAGRMAEVHACLIHDLSLAAIAMCRATLEAALIDRALQFGVEPFARRTARKETRKLSEIANDLKRVVPELRTSLDVVVTYGNQVLHAGSTGASTDLLRSNAPASIALHCFRHLRKLVERLYATE